MWVNGNDVCGSCKKVVYFSKKNIGGIEDVIQQGRVEEESLGLDVFMVTQNVEESSEIY